MNTLLTSLLRTTLLCLPLLASAADTVPDSGLKAEMEGRWQDAIAVYQKSLAEKPAQAHLWMRIADIQVHLKNNAQAISSLQTATKYTPRNAELYFRLSQLYASNEDKQAALATSNRAVELAPDNPDYLRARAAHANWNGDYQLAQQSYQHLLELRPGDEEVTLSLARTSMWMGDHEQAATAFRRYLAQQPDKKEARLELMEVEAERGDYSAAMAVGEEYRQRHGESLEYWLRAADLYALAGNDRASADALRRAARYTPKDAALYFRIARSHTEKQDAPHAMAAVEAALKLEPQNLEYLQARADLASWTADYPLAIDSYQRILAIEPDNSGALLGIARLHSWQGESDQAIKDYQRYLAKHPNIQVAWVEYLQLHMEIGNYAYVLQQLEQYREQFGETTEYLTLKARTYAWAQRPASAMPLVTRRLDEAADDYDAHYTRTIALNNDHRPAEAMASLDKLDKLRPESKDTADIRKYVSTPLRSHINLSGAYQDDSNDIRLQQLGLEGVYVLSPQTRFSLSGEQLRLQAPAGGGYEHINGEEQSRYQQLRLGLQQRLNSRLSLDLHAGVAKVEGADEHKTHELGVDIWPADGMSLRLTNATQLYAVSPRALSLQIVRKNSQLDLSWSPDLFYTIDAMVSDASLSDGNTFRELQLAPRRALLRNQKWNIDLGMSGQWLGYDFDPNNGYYAPESYQRYALNGYAYRKFSEDNALSISASAGSYRDNTMDNAGFSGSLSLEAYVGLYRDWMLDVRAGVFQNSSTETDAYRSRDIEFILTRRF